MAITEGDLIPVADYARASPDKAGDEHTVKAPATRVRLDDAPGVSASPGRSRRAFGHLPQAEEACPSAGTTEPAPGQTGQPIS